MTLKDIEPLAEESTRFSKREKDSEKLDEMAVLLKNPANIGVRVYFNDKNPPALAHRLKVRLSARRVDRLRTSTNVDEDDPRSGFVDLTKR